MIVLSWTKVDIFLWEITWCTSLQSRPVDTDLKLMETAYPTRWFVFGWSSGRLGRVMWWRRCGIIAFLPQHREGQSERHIFAHTGGQEPQHPIVHPPEVQSLIHAGVQASKQKTGGVLKHSLGWQWKLIPKSGAVDEFFKDMFIRWKTIPILWLSKPSYNLL